MDKVLIVAEMSANHCGDFEIAKKTIVAAKDSGADAIKIQTFKADTHTLDIKDDIFMLKAGTIWDGEYLYKLYQDTQMPWEWQPKLKEYADQIGIQLFSTTTCKESTDFLETFNNPIYKIAAFEAVDYPLIKHTAATMKPIIISTGISSIEEIQEIIDICKSVGNNDITILKCTSAYPSKLEDMNLITISDMIEKFGSQGVKIGLSDHSMNNETVVVGVALGAKVIEKHFTLDRALGGADSTFSLNPKEFKEMVQAVRNAEKVLGKVDYSVNMQNRKFARSLFVVEDINEGDSFNEKNIRSIRPSDGLHTKFYEDVLGKVSNCDLKRGTPMKMEYVK